MVTPCRLTIWITDAANPGTPIPPLVIDRGLSRDIVVRELIGEYQSAGTTAGGATQLVRGSQQHFVYNVQAVLDPDQLAVLEEIKSIQDTQGPPVSFRDEIERIGVRRIDGMGSRVRLAPGTFPDALAIRAGGTISTSHFESVGAIEVQDRLQANLGVSDGANAYEVAFRLIESV